MNLIERLNLNLDKTPYELVKILREKEFKPDEVAFVSELPHAPCFVYRTEYDSTPRYCSEAEFDDYDEEWRLNWTKHRRYAQEFDSPSDAWEALSNEWYFSSILWIFPCQN